MVPPLWRVTWRITQGDYRNGTARRPTGRPGSSDVRIPPVGASLLAMDVNDNAYCLNDRGVWTSIASRFAPTGKRVLLRLLFLILLLILIATRAEPIAAITAKPDMPTQLNARPQPYG